MSKANPLLGLIGYDDSDDESDDGTRHSTTAEKSRSVGAVAATAQTPAAASAAIHPAPIAHCPWSACYDETSGFTYYWNQQTNAVTWEAPPEYLLALKLAQQHLHTSGSAEVSAEEWQLYQQALAEKQNSQNKAIAKSSIKSVKKTEKSSQNKENKQKHVKNKRPFNEDDDEKIELITSYHNSDSESNDEADSPVKPVKPIKKTPPAPSIPVEPQKPIVKPNPHKKLKTKSQVVEYGPSLPPNQNYTFPIGPELPKEAVANNKQLEQKPASPKVKTTEEEITTKSDKDATQNDSEDIQDEQQLFMKLKDKAKLLEKLGGEIPQELQKMIEDGSSVENNTPKKEETKTMTDNIDDLLEEIEKKELPKVKSKKMDMFSDIHKTKDNSNQSPKSDRDKTPPLEAKPLFPSIKSIEEAKSLEQNSPRPSPQLSPQPSPPPALTDKDVDKKAEAIEKKGFNLYLPDASERFEKVGKKKLRISNSVLPDRKKNEEVAYTTKYSQFIEGFSDERTGLGFSKDEDSTDNPKATPISYGNGLVFTKGETLNEEKKDDNLDELTDLVEAKLQYLTQLQPCVVTPVQEMLIQMQTLGGAFRAGGLSPSYWSRWARRAASELRAHERRAAPPGWSAAFQRAEGRYCYRRESDGFIQWEYPAVASTDMDISTTPPHPGIENKEDPPPPPLPTSPPAPPPPPPMAPVAPSGRVRTPPPPSWADPPPPGCDDLPPLPPAEAKQEIGDELASFYSDIAQLEQQVAPNSASSSPPATPPPPTFDREDRKEIVREKEKEKERPKEVKVIKKKSKVKISSSIGLKQKSVSTLVAKWQQVAEEINSD